MKSIQIPKVLHKVFGKESTKIELTLTLGFAILATILLLTKTYSEWESLEIFQIVVIFIMAFDINGGVVANFTFSTSNQYKENAKDRLLFIAIHVQPLIMAFILADYYLPCVLTWGYTTISAFIINKYANHPAQRTIGAVFMAFGILGLILFFYALPKFLLGILIMYLIKVSFGFAVDHYMPREI